MKFPASSSLRLSVRNAVIFCTESSALGGVPGNRSPTRKKTASRSPAIAVTRRLRTSSSVIGRWSQRARTKLARKAEGDRGAVAAPVCGTGDGGPRAAGQAPDVEQRAQVRRAEPDGRLAALAADVELHRRQAARVGGADPNAHPSVPP